MFPAAWMSCVFAGFLLAGGARAATVVFSELMYNPLPSATNAADDDLFEFLELRNVSASPVNLSGAYFSDGITFTFPAGTNLAAGAYGLLVRSVASMTNRYGALTNILGVYTGKLANEGEKVTLRRSDGTVLFSVTYGDTFPWVEAADGEGASLVLEDADGNWDDPNNWGHSDAFRGTPGRAGSIWTPTVVVNEILAHTDAPQVDSIELLNLTTQSVSVLGWYVSDDAVLRAKYRITNAAPIPAGGFLVLNTNQFDNPSAAASNRFALSELGEKLYLTSSNLVRFADHVPFGASENGVSYGRSPDGWGGFTFMVTNTLGASNRSARVGPVILSEIMYHPASDNADEEYLELLNLTASPVPLYDPANPSNTWRIAKAVDYVFPTNVTLPAGGRLLVVGATNIPAFRSAYNIPTNVPVYGAWQGQLDNAGDSVRLYKPGAPETNGFVPQILVDRVDYLDATPWPTAPDGNGPSLERLVATNMANTASNWFVGSPGGSPGGGPVGGFFNPRVAPSAPAAGQSFTVTVSVVSQPLPTQVVCRTSVDGVTSNRVMRDNGINGDAVSNDQVYTVVIVGFTNTWLYYAFDGYSASGSVFSLPESQVEYVESPELEAEMSYGSPGISVVPSADWVTCTVTGLASHAETFYFQLLAAGEALVDDVSLVDMAGTNHVRNGSFDSALSGPWSLNGNHSNSCIEVLAEEGGNRVLHLKTPVDPVGWDNVGQTLYPQMVTGTPAVLSFRTRQPRLRVPHWLWVQVGAAPSDVVLNEVMYHPAQTNEADYEYVELFNPGLMAVNVSGWELDGAGFTIPAGTWIGATGYLVCAANAGAVQAYYGITNVIGGGFGTLQNDGETLVLKNTFGRELDRLDYDDRQPWPVAADGLGPSLERMTPGTATSVVVNWAGALAETNWQQVVLTGTIVQANSGIGFYLDYDGKCWLDDVSVKALGSNTELTVNGGFESGTNGWNPEGNHARSRVEAGMGRGGSTGLAVACNVTRWIIPDEVESLVEQYGDPFSNRVHSATLPTSNGISYVVSFWIRREGLSERFHSFSGGLSNTVWLGHRGTPGVLNSRHTTKPQPGITSVTRDNKVCPAGVGNVVRAAVVPGVVISNVVAWYRMVGSNSYEFTDGQYTPVNLKDDGTAPDLGAGDGEYAAALPASAVGGVLVRFHILATATNGMTARWPQLDDPATDECYWIEPASHVQTQLPNWTVFADGGPVLYPITARACAVSPDGQAVTDVLIRHRGNPIRDPERTGVALRLNKGQSLDMWFGENQSGINFISRKNDSDNPRDSAKYCARIVGQVVAYDLQRQIGLATPRYRHVCLWINGEPSVTLELEDPENAYLEGNGIPLSDYVTRFSYSGRKAIGECDVSLDNLYAMSEDLKAATNWTKTAAVATNLCLESVQHSAALVMALANSDQWLFWNMICHRSAADGRWRQYPWDTDASLNYLYVSNNLHPYYKTQLHPDGTGQERLLPSCLFYPESGMDAEYSLPYRHRHQMTLWRYCHTFFTTNALNPKIDSLWSTLSPAYTQIGAVTTNLAKQLDVLKGFIAERRDFLINGDWSDKNAALWNPTNVYVVTNVVINEIMSRAAPGGEYLELFNRGACSVDLSHWLLTISNESYRLPMGTMLGPTSYLVVADTQMGLTQFFTELGPDMVQRYRATPVWDWPVVWTTATEYASRVIEVPAITLPDAGATITLRDWLSNVVDTVAYAAAVPWPTSTTASIELVDPSTNNGVGAAWQSSLVVGTPGWVNSVAADRDGDGLPDAWEQRIADADGGDVITNVQGVSESDDFDGDGVPNGVEWVAGLDPTLGDADQLSLAIRVSNAVVTVEFDTLPPAGQQYWQYDARLYTLDWVTNLMSAGSWTNVPGFSDVPGLGQTVVCTNAGAGDREFYRYRIRLRDRR